MLEEYLGYTERHDDYEIVHPGIIKFKLMEAENLKKASNLGERFANRTFTNFDASRDRAAFDGCSRYANDANLLRRRQNSLLIVGDYGNGKTHLAAAISNVLINKGIPVLFGTFIEHLEHIREEFDRTGNRKYLSQMKVIPMLVIDDLGKEKKTEWTQQVLFDVINYRYEHLLPIIVTTNLARADNVDALANHVGGAVWSRLFEMCDMVATSGKDYRQQ